uniref:UDP-glucuronosyltransferase n=1 Tax=Scleropages formosus TaxID=113540 RepID=A0A8C9QVF1_SCLFO
MSKHGTLLTIWYLVFFTNHGFVGSSNILAVPVDGSHWNTMKVLILELAAKGHQVTVLRFSNYLNIDDESLDFRVITVQLPDSQARTKEERTQVALSWIFYNAFSKESCCTSAFWQLFVSTKRISEDYKLAIETMFENAAFMRQLRESGFNIVLADPFFPGGVMLAHYLNLPSVLFGRWMPTEDIHFRIAPSPLAYVPVLNSRLTDRMSFFQRLKNVLMYGCGNVLYHFFIYSTYDELCSRYLTPGISIYTLYTQADIYLMKFDFALDFLKPGMPNIIYIGGFHTKPAKSLPVELKAFMDSAEDGVVILSLGSIVNTLPEVVATEIAAGLALLPQRVVWRYTGPPIPTLGNNTKLLKWLPQNDLLSHPNTKAFITHGGENGIYEAIYHGVPVVGFPLFGDNYENLLRLSVKGVAVLLENLNRLSLKYNGDSSAQFSISLSTFSPALHLY